MANLKDFMDKLYNELKPLLVAYVKKSLAQDADKWITVKPNGAENKGSHVKIDGNTGEVKAGLGGKFNGQKINKISKAARNTPDFSHSGKIPENIVMQNRNRNKIGSIAQMNNISANPDYIRLGTSKFFESGAPVVAYGDVPKENMGRVIKMAMADGSQRLTAQYAVMEAGDVLTSNNADGSSNPEYDSDDATKTRAIAGNGRMAGLAAAYKKGNAKEYRKELIEDADAHGVDPKVIRKMKSPVLVRVMQPQDVTPDIGDKSNISGGLSLGAVEKANNDKNRIDFNKIELRADGSPTLNSIKDFVAQMPLSEKSSMIDDNGAPTREAEDRLKAAIFAKAYDNDQLTRLYNQALDPESRTIMNALAASSGKISKLEGLPDGFDIRDIIAEAAEKAINAKRSGKTLHEMAAQRDFEREDDEASSAILKVFADNERSAKAITTQLNKVAELLQQEAAGANSLFGESEQLSREEIIKRALSQDEKPPKMSMDAREHWRKNSYNFLTSVFDGKPDKRFLDKFAKRIF